MISVNLTLRKQSRRDRSAPGSSGDSDTRSNTGRGGAHLARAGAEAAAQTLCGALAVHAASVRLLPVRVPVGLRVVVKTASEARVVPPGVIVPLGPGQSRSRGEEREVWGGGSRTTALCYTAARSRRVVATLLLGAGSPSGVLTLRRPVGAYPWAEWPHPKPKFRPHLRLQIWRNRPQAHLRAAMPFPARKRRGRLLAPPPGQFSKPPTQQRKQELPGGPVHLCPSDRDPNVSRSSGSQAQA